MATTTPNKSLRFGPEHESQLEFVQATARYNAFISGIGAGKTVGGIGRMLRNVWDWNGGYTGFVVAPTVPSLRNTIIPELQKWGVIDRADFNRSEKRLDFENGSTVYLESADNDRKIERLRGPSIAWFWMDEAATIDKRAWDIMIGRLREGDYLNAFVTTTPKGYNWVYDRFVDDEDARVISGIPSHANPHLPDEYGEITDEYEGVFYEQEVLGKFRQAEGLIYPWFGQEHIIEEAPDSWDETIYGVDWGFNSPSVILALVRDGEEWVIVEEFYEREATINDLARIAEDMQERWGPGKFYCDPSQPENIEVFNRGSINAKKADNAIMPGIQHVSGLRDSLRVRETCQMARNELSQYQWRDDDDKDEPVKKMDHSCDALRYALFTDSNRGKPGGVMLDL